VASRNTYGNACSARLRSRNAATSTSRSAQIRDTGDTRATYAYSAYGSDDLDGFTGVDLPNPGDPNAEPYNPYRYTGMRLDSSSGGYDMGFRDYSPGVNRFLSRDSYNGALDDLGLAASPWTGNRYALSGGNPISGIELDGHVYQVETSGRAVSAVEQAKADLAAAELTKREAEQRITNAATELGSIAAEELGITAALDCFRGGEAGACVETALNVLTSSLGGAALKLAGKYLLKPGKAVKLAKRLWGLLEDIGGGLSALRRADRELDHARDALRAAQHAKATKTATNTGPVGGGTTRVFRVESPGNARLSIGPAGEVGVKGDGMLFLNFGDEGRALAFQQRRLAQGYAGTVVKTFDVPTSYVDELRAAAVPESMARSSPSSPLVVDVNQAADQFGLRACHLPGLLANIVPGSGRVMC